MTDASSGDLTIILTTSPTPSIPSTELICGVLESLPPTLALIPLIITFDGFTICQNENYIDGRLKRGQIPARMAEAYPDYIHNVKRLFTQDELQPSTDVRTDALVFKSHSSRDVTFIQHQRHQGFALSVKSALRYCTTPLVMVLQHDWVFEILPPISQLLQILRHEEEVNYITFVARYSTRYEHKMSKSNARLRAVLHTTKALRRGRELDSDLVACLHFFDRPHIAVVKMYRELFENYPRLRHGEFLEDSIGTKFSNAIRNASTNEEAILAWNTIGTWMYAPDGGLSRGLRHTSGRTTLTETEQKARIAAYIRENQQAKREGREPQYRYLVDSMIGPRKS
ncbi:hypothetical protein LTR10_017795 [Elasticomyces elasticus]|uniref:Uncharacterized protein n=1 Tax=Exophiala sideris TaxID=1016849 RepID=A0ABR0JCV8_9EURO|nr:hypothetical protein LTR10_017795 [Elasticomyces elasticus]KAK5031305.1 hypothetical protein LTS07_005040 [Exophiala sideris]KAK5039025.1 hypothetical protein LTR13_004056 [Exophiala sideris]KAK5060910.1 hypothetical protein LTR69_005509 [Exophiala sideris]KAK5183821.1 hypothetical protein LTR44_004103 [Eurotiomycetes sp. CCFEE 6388]